jgi:CIC family chloride channel protein
MRKALLDDDNFVLLAAIPVGLCAALATSAFRAALDGFGLLLFDSHADIVAAFAVLAWGWRIVVPALGGVVAGLLLKAAAHLSEREKGATDYMEAVASGTGHLPVGITLLRALASFCSIVTGSSVGKEGAMIQLAALCGSALPVPRSAGGGGGTHRRRMLTACGAAAGLTSVYHTPLAAAVFVAEVVFGVVAVDRLVPLLLASVAGTMLSRALGGWKPLYPGVDIPAELLRPPLLLASAGVGALAGVAGALFMRATSLARGAFTRVPGGLVARLALGGALVGLLAIWVPEVVGNGYWTISAILHAHPLSVGLAAVLLAKALATVLSIGSGAVGGVFTPSLFIGAALGQLLVGLVPGGEGAPLLPLVGMAAFLAATSQAPLMSLLMVFEMTLAPALLLPGMIGAVAAYYAASRLQALSLYGVVADRIEATASRRRARSQTLMGLCEPTDTTVGPDAKLEEADAAFARAGTRYLYVLDSGRRMLGALSIHALQAARHQGSVARVGDLVETDFPVLTPESRLPEALRLFAEHPLSRIPLVRAVAGESEGRELLGVVHKRRVVQDASAMF